MQVFVQLQRSGRCRCKGAEVRTSAGAEVKVQRCRYGGAEQVQSAEGRGQWCRYGGGAEQVQNWCRGADVQRWRWRCKGGGAELLVQLKRCRGAEVVKRWCKGSE